MQGDHLGFPRKRDFENQSSGTWQWRRSRRLQEYAGIVDIYHIIRYIVTTFTQGLFLDLTINVVCLEQIPVRLD